MLPENNLSVKKYKYCYALLLETLRRNPLDNECFKQLVMLTNIMSQNEEISFNLSELLNVYTHYTADFNMTTDEIVSLMAMLPTTISN